MKEHAWHEVDPSVYACANLGCTVTMDGVGFWQKMSGGRWRDGDIEPIPECEGGEESSESDASPLEAVRAAWREVQEYGVTPATAELMNNALDALERGPFRK